MQCQITSWTFLKLKEHLFLSSVKLEPEQVNSTPHPIPIPVQAVNHRESARQAKAGEERNRKCDGRRGGGRGGEGGSSEFQEQQGLNQS